MLYTLQFAGEIRVDVWKPQEARFIGSSHIVSTVAGPLCIDTLHANTYDVGYRKVTFKTSIETPNPATV